MIRASFFKNGRSRVGFVGAAAVALVLTGGAGVEQARSDTAVAIGIGIGASQGLVAHPPVSAGPERLVPVPTGGVLVELWSDPPAGALVRPGDRARIYFRANTDCYVTVISVDTEGRVRLLFPGPHDDGWVRGRTTYRLPARRAGYDLRFAGPPGPEYVYALASIHPVHDRYPAWLINGRVWDLEPWEYEDDWEVYQCGWVLGDPFYRMRRFCEDLVPYPDWYASYSTAYLSFHVGHRYEYPRYVCADCHWGHPVDPYGPACVAVTVRHSGFQISGWFDFRVVFVPRYHYVVHRHWRPAGCGPYWNGPAGRWVWSSADGRPDMRRHFNSASGIWKEGGKTSGRGKENGGRNAWDRGKGSDGRGAPGAPGKGVVVTPGTSGDRDAWSRAHRERLEAAVGDRPDDREKESLRSRGGRRGEEVASGTDVRPSGRASEDDRKRTEERGLYTREDAKKNSGARERPETRERTRDGGRKESDRKDTKDSDRKDKKDSDRKDKKDSDRKDTKDSDRKDKKDSDGEKKASSKDREAKEEKGKDRDRGSRSR